MLLSVGVGWQLASEVQKYLYGTLKLETFIISPKKLIIYFQKPINLAFPYYFCTTFYNHIVCVYELDTTVYIFRRKKNSNGFNGIVSDNFSGSACRY
jgi:hypothetical protein